jgi:ParB family transcriptional regulator, chromosome partitioning protein
MNSNQKKHPALGRGLGALLQNIETDITSSKDNPVGGIAMIPVDQIEANPFNPRTSFEVDALEQLSSSISEHGIIQPLTVRKMGRDRYQLISGERRFKASTLVGLTEVPCYIRIANDQAMLEMALVENIQRENLNSIEVAISFQRLIDECDLTQEQLSTKISKSRSDIANHLRLLKLPASIQAAVRDRKITMGHARALLSLSTEEEQAELLDKILSEELSVRNVEVLTQAKGNSKSSNKSKSTRDLSDQDKTYASFLGDRFNAKVDIAKNENGKGKIIFHFKNEKEYNKLMNVLKNE